VRRKAVSQKTDVLAYLQEHTGITPDDALTEFRAPIHRLAAVICELRKEGYNIVTIEHTYENAYGKGRYAEYRLVKGETV